MSAIAVSVSFLTLAVAVAVRHVAVFSAREVA